MNDHSPATRRDPDSAYWTPRAWLYETTPYWRLLPPPREESQSENGHNAFSFAPGEQVIGDYVPEADGWQLGPPRYLPPQPVEQDRAASVNWKALLQEIAETIVLTLLIFVAMRALIQNYRIEGISMEPNLHERQYLIVNKFAYYFGEPQRGDIIVFDASPWNNPAEHEKDYIKRIVGLPGDTVECRPNEIVVNGEALEEPYGPNPWNYTCGPYNLGPDEYFVLGDNRPASQDSHARGPLERKYIIGKAWLLYYPLSDLGMVPNYPLDAAPPPTVQSP